MTEFPCAEAEKEKPAVKKWLQFMEQLFAGLMPGTLVALLSLAVDPHSNLISNSANADAISDSSSSIPPSVYSKWNNSSLCWDSAFQWESRFPLFESHLLEIEAQILQEVAFLVLISFLLALLVVHWRQQQRRRNSRARAQASHCKTLATGALKLQQAKMDTCTSTNAIANTDPELQEKLEHQIKELQHKLKDAQENEEHFHSLQRQLELEKETSQQAKQQVEQLELLVQELRQQQQETEKQIKQEQEQKEPELQKQDDSQPIKRTLTPTSQQLVLQAKDIVQKNAGGSVDAQLENTLEFALSLSRDKESQSTLLKEANAANEELTRKFQQAQDANHNLTTQLQEVYANFGLLETQLQVFERQLHHNGKTQKQTSLKAAAATTTQTQAPEEVHPQPQHQQQAQDQKWIHEKEDLSNQIDALQRQLMEKTAQIRMMDLSSSTNQKDTANTRTLQAQNDDLAQNVQQLQRNIEQLKTKLLFQQLYSHSIMVELNRKNETLQTAVYQQQQHKSQDDTRKQEMQRDLQFLKGQVRDQQAQIASDHELRKELQAQLQPLQDNLVIAVQTIKDRDEQAKRPLGIKHSTV